MTDVRDYLLKDNSFSFPEEEGKPGDFLVVDGKGDIMWRNLDKNSEYQLYLKLKAKYESPTWDDEPMILQDNWK